MSDSGNPKVSHASEPASQLAAILTVTPPTQPGYPTTYTYTADGTLDSLFSDTVDLPASNLYRGLQIGVAGNIKVLDKDGNVVGPYPVPVGILPWAQVRRIFATGTTVTAVLGLR